MKASVEQVGEQFAFSERRACGLLLVPVSSFRYQPQHSDEALRERLVELAREKPRYGYRRLHVLLQRDGELVNHKRVHRIYREVRQLFTCNSLVKHKKPEAVADRATPQNPTALFWKRGFAPSNKDWPERGECGLCPDLYWRAWP